ncbi:MAG: multicopper oxidase domain-containing protein [Armatimonadota bacterium]|nr:multicopper oxidase domain-containing protein [Armatimonadota bacterium]MDR7496429.1 multicopper oxidase domain-containing protein [Armatimonadota bacterium]MDR7511448.1 multicopper oxidase domain-containing protein [Armatimonadota bacterium]
MGGGVSRRNLFRTTALGIAGAAAGALARTTRSLVEAARSGTADHALHAAATHGGGPAAGPPPAHATDLGVVGAFDLGRAPVDPMRYLTHFDWGRPSRAPGGRTLREYRIITQNRDVEVAPGVVFPAWTFNGQVPGPTLRARAGDRVRVHFSNGTLHPHNIHFHGFHPAEMDGVEPIPAGRSFVYEFDAEPFGLHLYHCHVQPLKRHIHKGLYGTFIIDPPEGRPPARELVMMMNAFDTNFDGENEIYAVNSLPFYYMRHPIRVRRNELVRVYLVNITEFDPINSFHLHANFFHVYRTGTRLTTTEFTDVITLGQAERAVLEFRYPRTGRFMFHAHQSEFVELGWMSFFEVVDDGAV